MSRQGGYSANSKLELNLLLGRTLDNCRIIFVRALLVLAFSGVPCSHATQDVEEPTQIIQLIRLLLSEPIVAAELHRLVDEGCSWENQVFWSGSPSEEALRTRVFWMTFSMKIATKSGKTYWKQFAFSRKAEPILEIKETTDLTKLLDCTQ